MLAELPVKRPTRIVVHQHVRRKGLQRRTHPVAVRLQPTNRLRVQHKLTPAPRRDQQRQHRAPDTLNQPRHAVLHTVKPTLLSHRRQTLLRLLLQTQRQRDARRPARTLTRRRVHTHTRDHRLTLDTTLRHTPAITLLAKLRLERLNLLATSRIISYTA